MDAVQQTLQVRFRFPVHFTARVFAPDNPVLGSLLDSPSGPASVVVVVDRGAAQAHASLLADIEQYIGARDRDVRLAAPILTIDGGEICKTDERYLTAIRDRIHEGALCRHSYVIAVGGGALLDVAGYAAATAHRGVRLVRVPTTVLAQADSAVGVKNGVNAYGLKNYLGAFAPPWAVVNDITFLPTLADRDWAGGLSEAVKVGLVKDPAFFDALERDAAALAGRDLDAMARAVRRSAELHLDHIAAGGDPFEHGTSRPLDFGHWAAHRLESITGGRIRHGEAVAVGIALDSTYSHLTGLLAEPEWERVLALVEQLGLAVYVPELDTAGPGPHHSALLHGLEEFREHLGGGLTILLLGGIGSPTEVHAVDADVMMQSIAILRTRQAGYRARPAGVAVFASE